MGVGWLCTLMGIMALTYLLMRERIIVRRGGKRCALKQCEQVRIAQRWRKAR
jgi:hypothetical protein